MMIRNNVKKGIRLVFVDFLGLLIGILNGFFLPMVFSIEGYALFKAFSLYAAYAVVFSFGLSDGMYLMYGGKNEANMDVSKTKAYYFFLMKLQAIVCVIMFIIAYLLLKDIALIFFGFFIIPLQLIHFFRLYYRALGEFDKYSLLQSVLVVFELLNTLFIVFYIKSQDPHLFISIKIINHAVVAALFSLLFFWKYRAVPSAGLKWSDYTAIMKPGFAVMMADMVAVLIFSLDRWFVMVLFTDEAFAYYSFAVSILNLFLVFITSVTNIFYSYISKKLGDGIFIRQLKNQVLIISSFFPVGFFILRDIIEVYLDKYSQALEILWILILTLPFVSVINVIYINLYKASKCIKAYLKKMIVILIVSFILNAAAYVLFKNTVAIAWATFIAFILWYFYSSGDFPDIKITMSEILYLMVMNISLYAVRAAELSLPLSIFVSMVVLIGNVLVFYKKDAYQIICNIRSIVHD